MRFDWIIYVTKIHNTEINTHLCDLSILCGIKYLLQLIFVAVSVAQGIQMPTLLFFLFSDSCIDLKSECKKWASDGKCSADKAYMDKNCPHTCNTCKKCTGMFHFQKLNKQPNI